MIPQVILSARLTFYHSDDCAVVAAALAAVLPETQGHVLNHVSVRAAVWHRSPAIHAWFRQHCQDGYDFCPEVWVSRPLLQSLVDMTLTVLADPRRADDLLPGHWQGWDSHDRLQQQLVYTRDTVTALLNNPGFARWEFYYHSSG